MFGPVINHPQCNPSCHSCHYKEFDYFTQLKLKDLWAEKQFYKWRNVLEKIIPASANSVIGYRTKAWFRVSFTDDQAFFGQFRSKKNKNRWEKEFISWDTCPLHTDPIKEILGVLKHSLKDQSVVGIWLAPPHIVLISKKSLFNDVINWNNILRFPFTQVWFHQNPQIGRHIFCHHPIIPLTEIKDSFPIRVFSQVQQSLLNEARKLAINYLLKNNPEMVVDFYCGIGELSLLLPKELNWLGIELSKDAIAYARVLRKQNEAFVGRVEDRLSDPGVIRKIKPPYSLYLNPPRMGLTLEAQDKIRTLFKKMAPDVIAYLACSASSLSRSLIFFEGEGYKISKIKPYDFFPQTEHFETLAILEKS